MTSRTPPQLSRDSFATTFNVATVRGSPVGQDSSKYGVTYVAALRLIDARMERLIDGKKGVVIADGSCRRVPEKSSSALGYQDFLANRAERLKNELEGAAHSCTDEFRAKVLTAGPAH